MPQYVNFLTSDPTGEAVYVRVKNQAELEAFLTQFPNAYTCHLTTIVPCPRPVKIFIVHSYTKSLLSLFYPF